MLRAGSIVKGYVSTASKDADRIPAVVRMERFPPLMLSCVALEIWPLEVECRLETSARDAPQQMFNAYGPWILGASAPRTA